MILEKETYEKFGYYPSDLKPKSGKKILAKCDDCGKVRELFKFAYRALCQSCWQKGERSYLFGICRNSKANPNWKGGLVKRMCEWCGKEFEVQHSLIEKGFGKFCSHKCHGEWQSKHRNGENNSGWKGGLVKCICEACGKEFEARPSELKKGHGRFCSHKCHGEWQSKHYRGENNPRWLGGVSFEPYCEKFDEPFREYIREKFDRICFLCPKTEAENGRKLSVHHVNYDKDCLCDDNLTCQFVPLCMSCHGKVNANREEWEAKINNMLHNSLKGWYI